MCVLSVAEEQEDKNIKRKIKEHILYGILKNLMGLPLFILNNSFFSVLEWYENISYTKKDKFHYW